MVISEVTEEPIVGNYFVAAYPPFSCWQPSQVGAVEEVLRQPPPAVPIGLYVHVPFCQTKCDYCYYVSYVGMPAAVIAAYLHDLVRELELYAGQPFVHGRLLSFVYFGGGTPSLLSVPQARRLGEGLRAALPWDGVEEVSFECAPRSVRSDLLETLREMGVTRLSMGVQSFDNELLRLNGRIHQAEDVARAYARIREVGFDWVNLDLMVGLIGETEEKWRESVRRVMALDPDSVTIYQTEIPHNTKLFRELRAGTLPAGPVSWALKRARLDYAFGELQRAGYHVVSGYAAVKNPARFCFRYQEYGWRGGDMLGLGVASFSYLGGVHSQNEATLESYRQKVENGLLPLQRAFRLSDRERLVREFILQLKWGKVVAADFLTKFGVDVVEAFAEPLRALVAEGLATVSPLGVRLTANGLLCVDRLLPRFYDPTYQNLRYT